MAANLPPMSPDFARWYFEQFMDEGTTRAERWTSVSELAAAADHHVIEVLVRLAFANKTPAGHKDEDLAAAHGKVVKIFAANPSFDAERNRRELQVLAAATLIQLLAFNPDAALAVTTASFAGVRKPELPMDLPGLAKRALSAFSLKMHERGDVDELRVEAPKLEFAVEQEAVNSNKWKDEIHLLRDVIAEAFEALVERQNEVVDDLYRRVEMGEEELQMLWWLSGGHSRVLEQPFGKLAVSIAPIVLGHELGEMTSSSPGPASIGAILAKAGIGTKALKVADAVNAISSEWAGQLSSLSTVSLMTTPLHFALEKQHEIGDQDAWVTVWAAQTGIPADVSLPAVEMAELFYREHLFLHLDS